MGQKTSWNSVNLLNPNKFTTSFLTIVIVIFFGILNFFILRFFILDVSFKDEGGIILQGFGGIVLIIVNALYGNTNSDNAQLVFFLFGSLINIPFFIFGYFALNHKIAIYGTLFLLVQILFALLVDKFHLHITNPFIATTDANKILSIVIGTIFLAIASGTIYRLGGSDSGLNVISLYIVKVKKTSVAKVIFTYNLIIIIVGSILLDFVLSHNGIRGFFDIRLLTNIIYVVVFFFIFRKLYPQGIDFHVEIICNSREELFSLLKSEKFKSPVFGINLYNKHRCQAEDHFVFYLGYLEAEYLKKLIENDKNIIEMNITPIKKKY